MTKKEILELLNQHEWKDVEFKEAKKDVPKNAYESVSAFANTEGGYLIFGVRKSGTKYEIVGITDVDKVQNDFISTLRQKDKISCIIDVKESLKTISGKDLLVFNIQEAKRQDKPVYLNGDIKRSFLRKGACDVKCSDVELKRLINDASKESYDNYILDFDINKCFNPKDITWYRQQYEGKAGNRSYLSLSDDEFLFQFGLIKETSSGRKPTVASILLFGQDGYLRDILPRPVIDCQRYLYDSTSMDEGRWHDRVVCDYNLVQTWSNILDWYYRFAEIPFDVDPKTMQRKDQPSDYFAFRESIVNILIHQDYSDQTRKAVIQHFSDMTRFWNPGDAFADIETLLEPEEKDVRNPLIVTAFRRIGFSEHAGWGLRDIFRSWRGLGYLPPEIINDKSKKTFELILRQEILLSEEHLAFQKKINVHLSQDEAAVFAYACRKLSVIHLNDIKAIIDKPVSECLEVANQLVNQALLAQVSENSFELDSGMKEKFTAMVHDGVHDEAHDQLNETETKILQACKEAKNTNQLLAILEYDSRTRNFRNALANLLGAGLIEMTIPSKPRSKYQKYIISEKGIDLLKRIENNGSRRE